MKITRYVNGKKMVNLDTKDLLIKQSIVRDTIERVNHRLNLNQSISKGQQYE